VFHQFPGCLTLEIEKIGIGHWNLCQVKISRKRYYRAPPFRGAPCIYLSRARGNGRNEDWRIEGGGRESKVGKNGEKGRERGTPCPTSNKLVIIFSQYLSWIGCYFIIFYCLLLLLLPVRKPPSVPAHPCTLRHPLTTLPSPLSSPFDRRQRPALFYYLEPLSAPREFTRGTHY